MSITSEINRIKTNISNAYDIAEEKGVVVPVNKTSANLASMINTMSKMPTGTLEITENTTYDVKNYAYAEVNVQGSNINNYNYELIRELEYEILHSDLSKVGLTALDILNTGDILDPLSGNWEYGPIDIAEKFKDVSTSGNMYVKEKFIEILGENNE